MPWIISAFADEVHPSIDKQIEALQANGLSWIDLRALDDHKISDVPADHAGTVAEKLAAAEIRVNMLGSPLGKIDIAEPFEPELEKLAPLSDLG